MTVDFIPIYNLMSVEVVRYR